MIFFIFLLHFALLREQSAKSFHSRGEFDGWDSAFSEHYGSVEEDPTIRFNGSQSLKFTQVRNYYSSRWAMSNSFLF